MTTKRAIEWLRIIRIIVDGRCYAEIALEMAIEALERQSQIQRAIEALQEKSAKYAEMFLETDPDTDEHILDRIRYRAAADIYANSANMVKVLLKGGGNDD